MKRSREEPPAEGHEVGEEAKRTAAALRAAEVTQFIQGLKFSRPLSVLRSHSERRECPQCHKQRQFYCYDCLQVCTPEVHPPQLSLPIEVHVLFHTGEHRSKSSIMAAATISPQIQVHLFPGLPPVECLDPRSTVILYPSPDAVALKDVPSLGSIRNVLFIDSTWQKSKQVCRDPRLASIPKVKITNQSTLFWRFQNNDESHLSTIEAIYHFLREYDVERRSRCSSGSEAGAKRDSPVVYDGRFDDLLFYFIYQYITIQRGYAESQKQFTTRHFDNYVLCGVPWDDMLGPSAKE